MIIFRKYTEKDLHFIAEMQSQLSQYHLQFDKDYYEPSDKSKDEFISYITTKMDDDEFNIIIAEKNNEIVGYAMGWISSRPPIYKIQKVGYLSNIFVHNTVRNSGVGKNLFNELEKWFKNKNVEYIETKSDSRNTNTIKKFRDYGFKVYSVTFYKKIK